MVIWTKASAQPDLSGQTLQGDGTPLEIYMEGNIVFRQGERVIHAERMYYDANNQVGTMLAGRHADAGAQLPRLAAAAGRHRAADRPRSVLRPQQASSPPAASRIPGYRLQARDVYFEDIQRPVVNPHHRRAGDRSRSPASRWSSTSNWPRARTTSCSSGRCRSSTGPCWPPTCRSRRTTCAGSMVRRTASSARRS